MTILDLTYGAASTPYEAAATPPPSAEIMADHTVGEIARPSSIRVWNEIFIRRPVEVHTTAVGRHP
ncbi:hypothetical protein FHR81_004251 [Actinoalloteichus hoggarensis]|uniref:hypothetical protein n=1 Tax=Actinoalloteichus hoggarensis TaxID=1470176 RepID=UPI0012FE5ADC|nr:hypothetical protein [Actinoalloteichus hoggarensis]MBB5923184.1 hypothetical protein [Actinoalloteichus hoggarensis]